MLRTTAVALLGTAALLSACGQKRGTLTESAQASAAAERESAPDAVIHDDIKLDFDEAQSSCEELIQDADEYPLSSYIDTVVDEDSKTITLIWPLKNEATEEDGVRYANELIRAFNDACADQDFSIARSTEESYGGLYQKYAVNIQVFREKDILAPELYLVSMTIPAGTNEAVVPFSQYDGTNIVTLTDGQAKVPGGKYTGDRTGLFTPDAD
ncbi:hypothetical protein QU660_08465 [Stomatobaculum sp. F0698]|uniref:hypothetical protein n=1 Tax=Stomatobaculum sp. F0698 TaxID=3059030 RepID=UPI00272CDB12|nr:hypothetical protein [Stomatobaculum sp. F0698]WLD86513.1 hypothetical protein QU660_08465 [Stomatobaculum sp. F0698]